MKAFFTTILLASATSSLILTIAAITNLNAAFTVEALEDSTTEINAEEVTTAEGLPAETPLEEISDLVTIEEEPISDDNAEEDTSVISPEEVLEDLIGQIKDDPTFQSYSRILGLTEQAENLAADDDAAREALKSELLSAMTEFAIIGGGSNADVEKIKGEFQTKSLEEILKDTSLIAHYHEYYELANLVKTAQTTLASNQLSSFKISQIIQATANAAEKVDVPVKVATTTGSIAKSSPRQSQETSTDQTNNETKKVTASSTTKYSVNRPSSTHSTTEYVEDEAETKNALADALAHTTTTCVAFGMLIIGKLSAKRQK